MLVYILVIILILVLKNRLNGMPAGELRNKRENRYLIIVCWILVLLSALRGSSVGTDTLSYVIGYKEMHYLSFSDVLEQYSDYPVFYSMVKLCSVLGFPVQLYLGIVASLYIYAIYRFIDRYSMDKLYSILAFTVIGLYSFSMAGLKQTFSMAFVLLYYLALEDKKYVKTILLAIAAYFSHHVSLIFLAGVALYYLRHLKVFYAYLVIVVAVVLFMSTLLWGEMLSLLQNEHYAKLYESDEGYSSTSMIITGVYLVVLFLFSANYSRIKREESRIMLGMSTMAFALYSFSFVSSTAFRLTYFFYPFMIVAFPNTFNYIGKANVRLIVKTGIELLLIFVFVYTNRNGGSVVPYLFFWQ